MSLLTGLPSNHSFLLIRDPSPFQEDLMSRDVLFMNLQILLLDQYSSSEMQKWIHISYVVRLPRAAMNPKRNLKKSHQKNLKKRSPKWNLQALSLLLTELILPYKIIHFFHTNYNFNNSLY